MRELSKRYYEIIKAKRCRFCGKQVALNSDNECIGCHFGKYDAKELGELTK